MTTQTHAPQKQALVTRVRANGALYALLVGGIHEGFAPEKASYPFACYSLVAAPYEYNWGDLTLIGMLDLTVFSRDSVEANNLDAALAAHLSDQAFPVPGQTTLLCRRVATIPAAPDVDDEGQKVYPVGGTYEVWTDAPL